MMCPPMRQWQAVIKEGTLDKVPKYIPLAYKSSPAPPAGQKVAADIFKPKL